jgi:hypothetical protein
MTRPTTHRARRQEPPASSLFARANPFLDLVWSADERRMCMSFGCGECGALSFRRLLADLARPGDAPNALARGLAGVDFALLRLAPHWYDALDIALFEQRNLPRGDEQLAHVVEAWLGREDVPTRVLDLVMFRHARYGHPNDALAELWVQRCLEVAGATGDEGLLETLILACPERVRAHQAAYGAAVETARRSPCVRSVIGRLPEVA